MVGKNQILWALWALGRRRPVNLGILGTTDLKVREAVRLDLGISISKKLPM